MDLKNLALIIFCLLFISSAKAQTPRKMRNSEIDRMNSQRQIKELKESVLLVRLRTRQPLIDALLKSDRKEEAKKIALEQLKKNQEIIAAFNKYYDFCPVFFFRSDYSNYVLNQQLDSVVFLNDTAGIDPGIKINSELFYIAEITALGKDTATFEEGTYLVQTEDGLERRTQYGGGGNNGFEALIFKSSTFYQLRRPFPYYSRTLQSLPIMRRSFKRVIQRANEALHYYYNRVY
ncbi:MAG: hypothetical protein ACI8ZM_003171 [Crocinitomix sp.]|jgi:hypothetical protein